MGAVEIVAAVLAGVALAWLGLRRQAAAAQAREMALAQAASRLGHDLRGALSPALLMAERLEGHTDPAVRQAATVIAQALDRANDSARAASALAQASLPKAGTAEARLGKPREVGG